MESSALRRLRSIASHLVPGETSTCGTDILRQRYLSSGWPRCPPPVVIGGMVLDVQARPYAATKPGTTTPGQIKYANGGVARNVAECTEKLGVKPFLISVVGHDMAGNILLEHWVSCELPTEGIRRLHNGSTPIVLNIFDASGELTAGVASAEAVENHVSPSWIEHFRQNISSAPIVMVDANLHPQSLETACRTAESNVPVWFEPVSVAKSKRVASVVKWITFASPNEEELIAMANSLSYGNELYSSVNMGNREGKKSIWCRLKSLKPAICLLLDRGVKVIVLTLGSDGVLVCSKDHSIFMENLKHTEYELLGRSQMHLVDSVNSICSLYHRNNFQNLAKAYSGSCALHFPAVSASVVSLVGAGDCLVGGMLASLCSGLNLMQSVAVAISTAKTAVESELNVPSQISMVEVAEYAKEILKSVTLFDLE